MIINLTPSINHLHTIPNVFTSLQKIFRLTAIMAYSFRDCLIGNIVNEIDYILASLVTKNEMLTQVQFSNLMFQTRFGCKLTTTIFHKTSRNHVLLVV